MTTEMAQLRRRACNDGDVIEDIPIETVQYNGSKAERKELDDSIMNSDHELRLKDKVADLDKRVYVLS
jgi:hypothetical protein